MLHGGHRSCRRVGPNADSASEDGIKLSLQVVDFTRSHIRKHPQSASTDCSLFVVRLGPREASPQALEMAKGGPAAVTGLAGPRRKTRRRTPLPALPSAVAEAAARNSRNWHRQSLTAPASLTLIVATPLSCNAEDATSALIPPLLVLAAILWLTMLSSIGLQLGGAEPGVESTYWWMGVAEDGKSRGKSSKSSKRKQKPTATPVILKHEVDARPVD